MPPSPLSRRTLFRRTFGAVAAGAATGAIPAQSPGTPAEPPRRAWIIVALNWETNDEFFYPEGEKVTSKLYYDQDEAQRACRTLCDQFFAEFPPSEFAPNWEEFEELAPPTATWDDLRDSGFPEPYYVLELTT